MARGQRALRAARGRLAPALLAALAPQLLAAPFQVDVVLVHLRTEVVLGQLRPAGAPAPLVLCLEHLVDVLELQLDLVLVRARGLPVQELRGRAGVPLA